MGRLPAQAGVPIDIWEHGWGKHLGSLPRGSGVDE
jgi:hypothetical protein